MKLTNRTERGRLRSQEALKTEAREALPFDPEREITAEDCARIRQAIETERQFSSTNMVWMFCVLFPAQADSLREKDRIYASNSGDAENYADELTTLKLLRPNEFKQKDYKQTTLREDLKMALNKKLQTRQANKWDHWVDAAICFKTLFPEDPPLLLSTEQIAEVREEIAWDHKSVRTHQLRELAKFKLLFPEEFSDLQLEHNDWREIRANIDRLRKEVATNTSVTYGLTFTLFSAKVLAAEHAEIDSQGMVVITPPARHLPTPQSLPARNLA